MKISLQKDIYLDGKTHLGLCVEDDYYSLSGDNGMNEDQITNELLECVSNAFRHGQNFAIEAMRSQLYKLKVVNLSKNKNKLRVFRSKKGTQQGTQ